MSNAIDSPKIFKFNGQEIPQEKWCWEAYYMGGAKLLQFDPETNLFHQFKEIQQDKLQLFRMNRIDNKMHYDLIFEPGEMKLIHFYINTSLRDEKYKFRSYCFGYERKIGKRTFKSLATILPTDYLTLSGSSFNLVIDIPEQ